MPIFDSHCHFADKKLIERQNDLWTEARDNNVHGVCVISIHEECYERIIAQIKQLREQFPEDLFSYAIGLHPHQANEFSEELFAKISTLCTEANAVGETGLDFFYDYGDRDKQIHSFRRHIELCAEIKKPLVIHCRNSKNEIMAHLDCEEIKNHSNPGILHCFTEDWTMAKQLLDWGFYISFSGILTFFPKAQEIRDVAKKIPLDRILVETDSPYLAPIPFRGKENHPGYVRHTFDCLCEIRDESVEQIEEQLWKNTRNVFTI